MSSFRVSASLGARREQASHTYDTAVNHDPPAAGMDTEDDFRSWYEDHAAPSHTADPGYHANLYCQRKETNAGRGGGGKKKKKIGMGASERRGRRRG